MTAHKRFYCKALQGKSGYNIAVNSDMTVSCNCMDYFGNGCIGNLRENSLVEIFDGEPARKLRRSLYDGEMPIPECRGCPELAVLDEGEGEEILENFHTPKAGIMVENTVVCNFKCLNCNRVDLMKTRSGKRMSLEDMRVVSREVKENEISTVHFFNLGEPFLSKTVLEEMKILKEGNASLSIQSSTHGMLLESDDKRDAALMMNHVFFSIDGSDNESVIKYQVGANFERSYRNMKDLVAYRNERGLKSPTIEWKYVVFPWNSDWETIDRAISLAKDAKVDILSFFRGGGENTYSPSEFDNLKSLKGVGYRSWRGKEIVFGRYNFDQLGRLLPKFREEPRSKSACLSDEALDEVVDCIQNNVMKPAEHFVRDAYCGLLEREVDEEGFHVYAEKVNEGSLSRRDFVRILLESDEFAQLG